MAIMYRYTRASRYLEASKKVCDFFMKQIEEDYIPAWDFRSTSKWVKDTSAAAVAASGMLELSQFDENVICYREGAEKILRAITEKYINLDNDNEAILKGATANKAAEENVEVGLIYADYYYTEAMRKLYINKADLPWEE